MKKVLKILGLVIVLSGIYYYWYVEFNYRFEAITEGRVYKSGLIKNESTLESLLINNKIKTVINLLDPDIQDKLNPATQVQIDDEERYIKSINKRNNLSIKHVNIPSRQVPTPETLEKFFAVLDDEDSYPVLIHCYHGTGRAHMYSALYRVEYEGYSNADARSMTRFIVDRFGYRSSFADGKDKGEFLMNYKKREKPE